MRFSLDDYLVSESKLNNGSVTLTSSISNLDTSSLHTNIRNPALRETNVDTILDPELDQLVQRLVIDINKLPNTTLNEPYISNIHISNENSWPRKSRIEDSQSFSSVISDSKVHHYVDNTSMIESLSLLLKNKFKQLSEINNNQVDYIRKEKKRQEENKLKELERQRQEKLRLEKEAKLEAEKLQKKQEQLKREKEIKLQQEKAELAKQEKLNQLKKAKSAKYITNRDSIESLFWSYKQKIQSIKDEIVLPIKMAQKPIKSPIMAQKRKINPKFGQLTNSWKQLQLIQNELVTLINQCKDATTSTTNPSPLAFKWILNFVAKAIVHQSESEIGVKPESALPLARLTIFLLNQYPELSDFLMARFVKKCPYIIGYSSLQDTEQRRINMGWKRKSDGKWENDTTYDERMNGMITLYSTITKLNSVNLPDPEQSQLWNIESSWRLVARMANLPKSLLINTHFVILGGWWDACGCEFIKKYGNQSVKLLNLIANEMTNLVSEKKFVGAARLRILYEEWQMTGTIKSFPEMVE
ncbi:nucleoporin GLE1 PWA37_000904 [Arxiozyma heterogenica]|uniref:mRNA export factor GLE1 n=1 Tax=Arxiozyma heterogenica TaxID=278026 RepID=A0AAN7ZSE7_9SACH|nr:hypothetical protein RI543_002819 [Kazachstania heterogenica]